MRETVGAVVSASGVIDGLMEINNLKDVGAGQVPDTPPWEQKVQSGLVPELSP